jgi:hypothetical protein
MVGIGKRREVVLGQTSRAMPEGIKFSEAM